MSATDPSLTQQYADHLVTTLQSAAKSTPAPKAKIWLPPSRLSLAEGNVIAFDQSLAACGMVWLTFDPSGLKVVDAQVFKTVSQPSNHAGNLARGTDLARQLRSYLSKAVYSHGSRNWTFIHEAPLTGGGRVRNTDSSLLAAQTIRIEMDYRGFPMAPMITAQQHKWATSGDRLISKSAHRAALMRLVELLGVEGYDQITNEAMRDAFSVAITHLIRAEQETDAPT